MKFLKELKHRLAVWRYRMFPGTFTFQGRNYRYFHHPYNNTWTNERAVELALAKHELQKYRDKRVLELGNVLNHYLKQPHDVVDKYEPGEGVVNVDIIDFNPGKPYDLILSISTLEHVGWDSIAMTDGVAPDEESKEPTKIPETLERLSVMLAPGGRLVVTVPFGYNDFLNDFLANDTLPFTETRYLRRMAEPNKWREVPKEEVVGTPYGYDRGSAEAIAVGIIQK